MTVTAVTVVTVRVNWYYYGFLYSLSREWVIPRHNYTELILGFGHLGHLFTYRGSINPNDPIKDNKCPRCPFSPDITIPS